MLTAMLIGLCAVVMITLCAAYLIKLQKAPKECMCVYEETRVENLVKNYDHSIHVGVCYHLKCVKCGDRVFRTHLHNKDKSNLSY